MQNEQQHRDGQDAEVGDDERTGVDLLGDRGESRTEDPEPDHWEELTEDAGEEDLLDRDIAFGRNRE